jgi:anti-sigma factor RsiW
MTGCDAMREDLVEAALGQPASETLRSHLDECEACVAELERQRALAQRMDAAVGRFVSTEPPAKLLEGVRARARITRSQDGSTQQRSWRRRWAGISVGAAIAASLVLMVGVQLLRHHPISGSSAVALTAWRSPTAALLVPLGSVLHAPLRDVWFDPSGRRAHSKPLPGGTHGT